MDELFSITCIFKIDKFANFMPTFRDISISGSAVSESKQFLKSTIRCL